MAAAVGEGNKMKWLAWTNTGKLWVISDLSTETFGKMTDFRSFLQKTSVGSVSHFDTNLIQSFGASYEFYAGKHTNRPQRNTEILSCFLQFSVFINWLNSVITKYYIQPSFLGPHLSQLPQNEDTHSILLVHLRQQNRTTAAFSSVCCI